MTIRNIIIMEKFGILQQLVKHDAGTQRAKVVSADVFSAGSPQAASL